MNDLGMNEYQKLAARTMNDSLNHNESRMHALHGIASEVGEVHSLFQKTYQGHPIDDEHLRKEIGDVLWFVAELCTVLGFNMGDIAQMNIDKLKARFPDGFDADKSLNRTEGDV